MFTQQQWDEINKTLEMIRNATKDNKKQDRQKFIREALLNHAASGIWHLVNLWIDD